MKRIASNRIVVLAILLPPIVLSLLVFVFSQVGQSGQGIASVILFLFAPLAMFVELAALIVGFSQWRAGQFGGVVGLLCAGVGLFSLVGAIFIIGLLFSGAGV